MTTDTILTLVALILLWRLLVWSPRRPGEWEQKARSNHKRKLR